MQHPMQRLALGGGCHWCTEAVFQALGGVCCVRQGFARSDPPDDTWSEAIDLEFDPGRLSLDDIIAVHLATHASTSHHKLRGKYRSAIYLPDTAQQTRAAESLARLSTETGVDFVTRILPHRGFRESDQRFHNYFATDPDRPFCQTYIEPKLALLRQRFANLLKEGVTPA